MRVKVFGMAALLAVGLVAGCGREKPRDAGTGPGGPVPGTATAAPSPHIDVARLYLPVAAGVSQVGTWEPANVNWKVTLTQGEIRPPAGGYPDPLAGEIRWADGVTRVRPLLGVEAALVGARAKGAPPCGPHCPPLQVTAARWTELKVSTGNGEATVPAWELAFAGTAVKALVPAVAPDPDPGPGVAPVRPSGIRPDRFSVSADDRTLTLSFTGGPDGDAPCSTTYTLGVEQRDDAVLVVLREHRKPSDVDACPMIGKSRTLDVPLDAPLAGRPVLDERGLTVARK